MAPIPKELSNTWPAGVVWGVHITFFGLAMAVMFGVVSFWLWRKMRGDYNEEEVLSLAGLLAFLAVVGGYVGGWGAVVGGILGLWWWCSRRKWNFWEWLDSVGRAGLATMAVGWIAWGPGAWAYSLAVGVGWLGTGWLGRSYRKISWYKSGKPGIVGLAAGGWWAAVEIIRVAKANGPGVYLLSLPGFWVPALVLVLAGVAIYVRSGHNMKLWRN